MSDFSLVCRSPLTHHHYRDSCSDCRVHLQKQSECRVSLLPVFSKACLNRGFNLMLCLLSSSPQSSRIVSLKWLTNTTTAQLNSKRQWTNCRRMWVQRKLPTHCLCRVTTPSHNTSASCWSVLHAWHCFLLQSCLLTQVISFYTTFVTRSLLACLFILNVFFICTCRWNAAVWTALWTGNTSNLKETLCPTHAARMSLRTVG